uniref:Si:ch211-152c2.3 n=1 Tax=Iconisemion striatum TaxID=60296 RepID=A0A1A7Y6Y5_9TELE
MKMFKMMLVQLGVLLLAICISAQSSTITPIKVSNTSTATGTYNTGTGNTTMAKGTYSTGTGNTTTASNGAGVLLQAGTFSALTPVIMAASLLQRYC